MYNAWVMSLVLWAAATIVLYTYVGYPALVFAASRLRSVPAGDLSFRPTISIIISLYNEEDHVAGKIESVRCLDYPRDRVQILIGSDGSTDRTNAILESHASGIGATVFYQERRAGKPAMLNTLAGMATGEVFVFTDARQRLDRMAVAQLVKHFADPQVGSVSAELHLESSAGKPASVGLYWEYEKLIRRSESRLGSMLGATGALYAMRRALFTPVPPGLVLDDVYLPMKVVQKGYRAIFEPAAKIYDRTASSAGAEFTRKARTLAGNFQLFRHLRWALNPLSGIVAWQFFSHKVLRLFVPYCLLAIAVANLFLLDQVFYRLTFALQAAFYLLAAAGSFVHRPSRIVDVPHMFCVMNWAAVVGLYRFATDAQQSAWQKAVDR